jgi:hypothetical protein
MHLKSRSFIKLIDAERMFKQSRDIGPEQLAAGGQNQSVIA